MKSLRLTPLLLLLSLLYFTSVGFGQSVQSQNWQKINADGLFTFDLPESFRKTEMTGVENYLGEYRNNETRFLFIWADTASNSFDARRESDMEEYRETKTVVDGRKAYIQTYSRIADNKRRYFAELNVGNWENGDVQLYMKIEGANNLDLVTAKQIFDSIKFLRKCTT